MAYATEAGDEGVCQFDKGTSLTFHQKDGGVLSARVLCPDGVVRVTRSIARHGSKWRRRATITVNGRIVTGTVAGLGTGRDMYLMFIATDRQDATLFEGVS